jgi:N-acetylglutamate synthase/N-acetylornithine aminotransferase
MSLLSRVFGVGGDSIAKPIDAIGRAIDAVTTTDEEKAAAQIILQQLAQKPGELQAAINSLEAQHRTVFVAGWRPAVGWVCVVALFNAYLFNPWLQWSTGRIGPQLPMDSIMELVLGMLGLGVLRTVEIMGGRKK